MNVIVFEGERKGVFVLTIICAPDLTKCGRKDRITEVGFLKFTYISSYSKTWEH